MGDFDLITYVLVGLVLMFASALQGAVGFAAGLFGIPLLMLVAGMEPPAAIMTMLLASFIQNLGGLYHLREEFNFRRARAPMLIRLATIPAGLAALYTATSFPQEYFKATIGLVILLLLVLQWTLAPAEPTELHPAWMPVAFGSSGFLVGFCGMGGPPMVLWVMAQPWSAERSRAFLFFLFATSLLPQCLLLWWMFGSSVRIAMIMAVLSIPWIILGTWCGLWIGTHLPKERLRIATYSILVIIAISAMLSPFLPVAGE